MLGGLRVAFNLASTAANITTVLSGAIALFTPADRAAADQALAAVIAK